MAFLIPLLFMFFMLVLRVMGSDEREKRNRGLTNVRIAVEVLVGCALLFFPLQVLPGYAQSAHAYDNDPSCRNAIELTPPSSKDACTVVAATIQGSPSRLRREGYRPAFDVFLRNGKQLEMVAEATRRNVEIWQASRGRLDAAARVQLFAGRVMSITTGGGTVKAYIEPDDELDHQRTVGAFGGGLVVAGLLEIVIATFLLSKNTVR